MLVGDAQGVLLEQVVVLPPAVQVEVGVEVVAEGDVAAGRPLEGEVAQVAAEVVGVEGVPDPAAAQVAVAALALVPGAVEAVALDLEVAGVLGDDRVRAGHLGLQPACPVVGGPLEDDAVHRVLGRHVAVVVHGLGGGRAVAAAAELGQAGQVLGEGEVLETDALDHLQRGDLAGVRLVAERGGAVRGGVDREVPLQRAVQGDRPGGGVDRGEPEHLLPHVEVVHLAAVGDALLLVELDAVGGADPDVAAEGELLHVGLGVQLHEVLALPGRPAGVGGLGADLDAGGPVLVDAALEDVLAVRRGGGPVVLVALGDVPGLDAEQPSAGPDPAAGADVAAAARLHAVLVPAAVDQGVVAGVDVGSEHQAGAAVAGALAAQHEVVGVGVDLPGEVDPAGRQGDQREPVEVGARRAGGLDVVDRALEAGGVVDAVVRPDRVLGGEPVRGDPAGGVVGQAAVVGQRQAAPVPGPGPVRHAGGRAGPVGVAQVRALRAGAGRDGGHRGRPGRRGEDGAGEGGQGEGEQQAGEQRGRRS